MNRDQVLVILAAGIGRRFWPIDYPKALFPIMGRPFLSYCLGNRVPKGITRVVIVANQDNARMFSDYKFPVPCQVVIQNQTDGMAGALLAASAQIRDAGVLLVIADHYVAPEALDRIMEKANDRRFFGIINAWESPDYFPGGYLKISGNDGRIEKIIEKPGRGHEPGKLVNVSGHYYQNATDLIQKINSITIVPGSDDRYEQAVTALCLDHKIVAETYRLASFSLKYPWDILTATSQLLSQISSFEGDNVSVKANIVIEGTVYLGNNVRIYEFSKIVGPCYLGDNTIVGNGCLVREAILEGETVVGSGTEITRSYVGKNCWFHRNYVGDSVIMPDVGMGSGATTANLRLDDGPVKSVVGNEKQETTRVKLGAIIGKGSRVGVNVSLMPGVKIGYQSYLSSGLTIGHDIESLTFVHGKTELIQKTNRHSGFSKSRDEFRRRI
jgi:bifunctional UDP-N-acetylglucosamine pyrophosphorylase/glucosamine-1-phosphate N-acetyltransferase